MRLLELEIENFGVFADKRLEFGDGLQLICGPNEAGKSTLLQLVREVFFGFPHSTPYDFAGRTGEMAATARIELADGRKVRYRRRKGRKGTVVGNFEDSGDAVNEATLANLLGNANAELYANIFGFSLAELSAGQKSLRQESLTEALYGGGLGGLANFQKVREEIKAEYDSLFSPRASKPTINSSLARIKEQKKAVTQATVKPRDFQKVQDEAKGLDEEVEDIRRQREEIQRKQAHLKRLAEALPLWFGMQAAGGELAQLEVPDAFPPDGRERYQRARDRRNELAAELEQARSDLGELTENLDAIELKPELVAKEAAVKKLERRIDLIRGFVRDIPQREQESVTTKEKVLAQVKRLNPEWDLPHLDHFQTSLAQRETIEAMAEELEKLEREKDKLDALRPDLIEQISQIEAELGELEKVEVDPSLQRLVERAASYEADLQTAKEQKEQLDEVKAELDELQRRLGAPLRVTIEDPTALPVPLAATMTEFRDRFTDSDKVIRDAERRLEEAEDAVAEKERRLAELEALERIPDREQLVAQRERRDDGWRLIRRKYVDGASDVTDEEVTDWLGGSDEPLPERYEREVESADQHADQRQDKAEQVARREQLVAEVGSLRARRTDLKGRLTALNEEREQLKTEWNSAWSGCGFPPLSPTEMLDWLRIHDDLAEKTHHRERQNSKLREVNNRIENFEAELRTATGEGDSGEEQLTEVRRRVEDARTAATRREQYEVDLPKLQRRRKKLDADIATVAQNRDQWEGRWRVLLDELGLPADWSVRTATNILRGLADARQEYSNALELDKRVRDMEKGIEQYRGEVVPLCRDIAPDLADFAPEDAVLELAKRIDGAKHAERDHETFTAQKKKAENLAERKEQQLDDLKREIAALQEAAGAADEAGFEEVATAAHRKKELEAEIEGLDRDLKRVAAEEDVDQFLEELKQAKLDDVRLQRQRTDEEYNEIEERYKTKLQQAAIARDRLSKLDRASEAAELTMELESSRAELAAAVDRWAPLVLAQTLMSRAIERFEREHQPEMLQEIGQLFSRMTLGRYTGVRRKLDEKGTLLLESHDGSQKEPHELSTGTREQLYLAMRLAYVHHYCRDAEPLPLVMDDVLVNFDDARAQSTLEVLLDVAKEIQIIFMTCHQNMTDLITRAAPDMTPIRLSINAASAS